MELLKNILENIYYNLYKNKPSIKDNSLYSNKDCFISNIILLISKITKPENIKDEKYININLVKSCIDVLIDEFVYDEISSSVFITRTINIILKYFFDYNSDYIFLKTIVNNRFRELNEKGKIINNSLKPTIIDNNIKFRTKTRAKESLDKEIKDKVINRASIFIKMRDLFFKIVNKLRPIINKILTIIKNNIKQTEDINNIQPPIQEIKTPREKPLEPEQEIELDTIPQNNLNKNIKPTEIILKPPKDNAEEILPEENNNTKYNKTKEDDNKDIKNIKNNNEKDNPQQNTNNTIDENENNKKKENNDTPELNNDKNNKTLKSDNHDPHDPKDPNSAVMGIPPEEDVDKKENEDIKNNLKRTLNDNIRNNDIFDNEIDDSIMTKFMTKDFANIIKEQVDKNDISNDKYNSLNNNEDILDEEIQNIKFINNDDKSIPKETIELNRKNIGKYTEMITTKNNENDKDSERGI